MLACLLYHSQFRNRLEQRFECQIEYVGWLSQMNETRSSQSFMMSVYFYLILQTLSESLSYFSVNSVHCVLLGVVQGLILLSFHLAEFAAFF